MIRFTLIRTILTCLLFILAGVALAQRKNYLSIEALGSGGLGSLNFEHEVFDSEVTDLQLRLGLSFVPIDKNNGTAVIFPVMLHSIVGRYNHKLDMGIGQTLSITTKGSVFLRMPFSVGYRFEPADKRYYLRASYTPIISYIYNFQWEHWGGLTFGFRINP